MTTACAFLPVAITSVGAPTSPSALIALTLILCPGYDAAKSHQPVRSVVMDAMLSGSGAVPSLVNAPVFGSIEKLATWNGCERIAAYRKRLSGLTARGITAPPAS